MPRIVVGVDASPDSKAALAWAAEEARLRQAVLQVVFAFHARELGAPEYVPTQHGLPGAGVNPSLEGFDAGFVAEPDMTGTLRAYRGRGFALLAKRATLVNAAGRGVVLVLTENDETNAPMLSVNEKLGYRPAGSTLGWSRP